MEDVLMFGSIFLTLFAMFMWFVILPVIGLLWCCGVL